MTDTTQEKRNFKDTLNLPRTGFPMRANLAQNEPQSQKRWAQVDLYARIQRARERAERFNFHDGPPYANGSIHAGHLLNKVLKDFVVRTRLMEGLRCPYVPGWDCHGLPIEHKVMTELVASGKMDKLNSLEDDVRRMAIRRECQKYAEKFVKHQMQQMQRLLTLADYDEPYLTMNPRYERAVLEVFAVMIERGIVYRDLKPVHWSIANQTALAEAELEYEDRKDPSVYVDFEAVDRDAVAQAFGVELDMTPSFMIWTTTPWTLPSNLAIAVHERFRYALVKIDGNLTVLASDLVKKVAEVGGAEKVAVLAETDGRNLVGLKYRHPFCERVSTIVAAEYVTLEDGTGLVHTAPGHGAEDYATGLREGLDIYCPVRGDGTYDDTVPEWLRGMSVWDANPKITEHLRASGHLFHHHSFIHSYPHDWRSRTPVIFRATEQWFIGVDIPLPSPSAGGGRGVGGEGATNKQADVVDANASQARSTLTPSLSPPRNGERGSETLRELALNAASHDIRFIPEWGRNRMRGMLESRPDWCLSRQRAWGLPIPAFEMQDGTVFLTAASVRAIAQIFGEKGSDAWFTSPPEVLLAGYNAKDDPDAPPGLSRESLSTLKKMHDIFDVWFESGSSWNAVLRERDLGYPADLYLEGSDQHRGWFQLSLLPALAMTGESPFKSVLTHGFVNDKDGKKMSKSGGNALDVDDVLKNYGADVCRWWVSSLAYENDVKGDVSFLDLAGESYRKVRNTLRFLLSNLDDFDGASMQVNAANIPPMSLDAYALAEGEKLQAAVRRAFEQYEFRKAHQLIYDFCNDTLSAFYCAAVKDRLYCDKPDSIRRRTTQTVMHHLSEMLCRLLAPLLPHTADEAWRSLHHVEGADAATVHEQTHVALPKVTADPGWLKVLRLRDEALKALEDAKERGIENPLDAEVVVPDAEHVFARFLPDLADVLGVSRVKLVDDAKQPITINDLRTEPRCERSWKRDGTVKQRADGSMLSDRDAEAVRI